MYNLGPFPCVVPEDAVDARVFGEVYDTPRDTLELLDIIEGGLYVRKPYTTAVGDVVFTYVWNQPLPAWAPQVKNGFWRQNA